MNYDNDEDSLEFINRLLEQLHQAGHTNHGSKIQFVYVASGGQHVETQINVGAHSDTPKRREKPHSSSPKGRGGTPAAKSFNDDTPLSALFRENHHEELRQVIESWRPYLIGDDPIVDALVMGRFRFDKDRIYSNKVYRDLCELDAHGALQVPMSQLARFMAARSNLSRSYSTLYQQLKYYRGERE